jgi:SAM-dependent methyltransferase
MTPHVRWGRFAMNVTSRFVLDFARERRGARVLDFGCGAGNLVVAGRAAGLDITGADSFYAGSNARGEAETAGLLGSAVFEIRDGRLPFPGSSFDLVVDNQVFEHVEDLEGALAEIDRVLRPGGEMLSIFPASDVWREGHIGIPFAHRFRRGSRARFLWTCALRRLGLGYWKEQVPDCGQWARDKLAWIDSYTRYRPRREILAAFERHFQNEFREIDYIRYRLRDRRWRAPLAALAGMPVARQGATALFRKLAFLVIVSRKENP